MNFLRMLYAKIPPPEMTRMRSLRLFEWLNRNALGKKVLNLGSGVGHFDKYLSAGIKAVKLDIDPAKPGLDVVADAQRLPFKNESFEIVYSIAVLEHVRKPWLAAGEITRILRSGGHVVVELPFLNVIHAAEDYFRFTDKGIRSLFDESGYDLVLDEVGSGGGSFLSVFLVVYLRQFVPTKAGKALWYVVMRYIFSICRYLDALLGRSADLRATANSFTFIARKR